MGEPTGPLTDVAEAARRLGVGKRRILQMLRADDDSPLASPPGDGGRGRPRQVYASSIEDALIARQNPRKSEGSGLSSRVDDLSARLDALTAVVDAIRNTASAQGGVVVAGSAENVRLRQENERLKFELAKSDAASDALRDAMAEQDAADALRQQAAQHDAAARRALLRAEKARDDSRPPPTDPDGGS